MKPEFINRVDDIIVFRPLTKAHLMDIVDVQMERVAERLADKNIVIEMSGAARELLAHRGYDPKYGARPLKRAIQRLVLDPLAMEILEGKITEGTTVTLEVENEELKFGQRVERAA